MLFRWLKIDEDPSHDKPSASAELKRLLSASMPEATAESAAIVGAVAGLLAFVAYADRSYAAEEQRAVEAALARVQGLPEHAVAGISALLATRIAELAAEPLPSYTRVLYDLTEKSARLELFEVLMDLAAADEVLSMDETHGLRRVAKLLGLADADYLAAQARHRDRLSVLR